MNHGYTEQIRDRIISAPDGSVFVNSDFADIADNNTIRQSISRLVREGILRRVIRGVFDKPKYSKLLGEYVAADPDVVAKALARCYHWTVAPCGDTALNMLGLSTQATAVWSYISDGPYKTYEWDKTKIEFKHRINKEVTSLLQKELKQRIGLTLKPQKNIIFLTLDFGMQELTFASNRFISRGAFVKV